MRKGMFRFLSALLAACLLLSCTALTEEMSEGAEIIMEDAATLAEGAEETLAEETEEIAAEPVEEGVTETEAELAEPEDDVFIAEEETIELYEPDESLSEGEEVQELDAALPLDGDALFEGYARGLFGLNQGKLFAPRHVGGDLTGDAKSLYSFLKARVAEIAAGQRSSTELTSTHGGHLSWDAIYKVVLCLVADCPYEMYWYANHVQFIKGGGKLTVLFLVSSNYAAGDFRVDTSKVARAARAASNARAIVSRYASRSDYDKLVAYRDEICNLVSYNRQAVSGDWSYKNMDPWQLVWVFDGDSSTNVVCEGYAEAFQYLCDLTHFSGNVICYCATGTVNGGAHKWNIVRMPNGRNYHVDVTWCDRSSGYDWFFLKAPVSGSVSAGYSFDVRGLKASYRYDTDCMSLYTTGDLKLSSGNYLNEINLKSGVTVLRNMKYTVNMGTTFQIDLNGAVASSFSSSKKKVAVVNSSGMVEARAAGKTKITIKIGRKKRVLTLTVVDPTIPRSITLDRKGTVRWYKQDALTLKASIPAGTNSPISWKSSNKRVATVSNGVVTFRRTGAVTITATATRGKKKAKVRLKVVDGSRATSIRINTPATTTLKVGQTLRLTAAAAIPRPVNPANPTWDPRATWKSSNKKVLAVNKTTGVITAKKPGTAVITVTAGSKKKAKIRITVT